MDELVKKSRKPSFTFSFILMLALFVVVIVPYVKWNVPMAAMFFLSWLFVIPACMTLGHSYSELESAAFKYCEKIISTIFILLSVGGMIGAWIAAGTVSSVVHIGLNLISPKFFLVIAFAIAAVYAMACGTSWGTLGTIGVAMSAVGIGLGVPPAMTAGAIVSAAFMGDGFSPMSDAPNLCAAVTEVKLLDHVKHLAKVQIPVLIINTVLYLVLGFQYGNGTVQTAVVSEVIETLGSNYKIGFIAFLPAITVMVMLLMKKSAVCSILTSSAVGLVVAVIYQGKTLAQTLVCFWSGVKSNTGMELVDTLLSRGGELPACSPARRFIWLHSV